MAGLVFFWSLSAFVFFVTTLIWRASATGDRLSPGRRGGFAVTLGLATFALTMLASSLPVPSPPWFLFIVEPETRPRAIVVALVAGAFVAALVHAQLTRPEGRSRFFLRPLLALAVLLPIITLFAQPDESYLDTFHHPEMSTVDPSLQEVLLHAGSNQCDTAFFLGERSHAHLACAPGIEAPVEREWVIETRATVDDESVLPLYLSRVCPFDEGTHVPSTCTFTLSRTPIDDEQIDLHPRTTGLSVDATLAQWMSFDPVRRLWVIEGMRHGVAVTPRLLVDAEGSADDPVRIVDDEVDVTHALGAAARRRIPPSPWAFFLGLTALGTTLALRARKKAIAQQQTLLASARSAELRDGLLYVEDETVPRHVVETAGSAAWHLSGPVVWQPATTGGGTSYRQSAVALAADLVPGDVTEHRERAKLAVARAFALFAAMVGCGALPVFAAGVAHAIDPGDVVTFHPAPVKQLATLRSACAPGTDLVAGAPDSPDERPRHLPRHDLKAWFCRDSRQVDVASYRACVGSGACAAPRSADQASCNWNRPGSDATLPMNCVSRQEASLYCEAQGQKLSSAVESPVDLEERDRRFRGLPPDPAHETRCDAYLCPHEQHGSELYLCDESGCSISGAAAIDTGFRCVSAPRTVGLDERR